MITCLHYPAPDEARTLLVMLPGAGMAAADFAAHGMVAAVHGPGLAVDVIAAQPELDLYLDGGIAAALHDGVIAPARQRYRRVWLLGISLGGMGALLYASRYAHQVAGLVLLAPFLGTQGTIAEMGKAGGLATWSASTSAAVPSEQAMLGWLQDYARTLPPAPALYLGYGLADRFAPGHRMLAAALPADRVVTAPGGHDWDSWVAVWRLLLGRLRDQLDDPAEPRIPWPGAQRRSD